MYMYAFVREGLEEPHHTEYYLDEATAKNRIISFAIRTRCISCVYVYKIDSTTPTEKMRLVKRIEMAADETRRFCKIWLRQDAENLSSKYILDNPEIMYDCLQYVNCF